MTGGAQRRGGVLREDATLLGCCLLSQLEDWDLWSSLLGACKNMHNHSHACTQTHTSLYFQLCEDIYWRRGAHIQSKPVLNGLNEAGVLSYRGTAPSHWNPTHTVCQRWTETFCLKSEANNEVSDVQHQWDLLGAASKTLAPAHADSFSSMK